MKLKVALIFRQFEKKFKLLLLHYGKNYASLPIIHSTKLKKDYNNIETVLKKLDYDSH